MDQLIGDRAALDLPRPRDQTGDAKIAIPIGVFLGSRRE